jgi:hypothetical protein
MRAVSRPAAPHRFREDLLGFIGGCGLQAGVHFGEQNPQSRRNFASALLGSRSPFKRLYADRFSIVEGTAQQQFSSFSLRGRQVSYLMNHAIVLIAIIARSVVPMLASQKVFTLASR